VQHLIQSLSAPQKDVYIFYRSFSLADEKYDRQTNYPKSSSQKFRGSSGLGCGLSYRSMFGVITLKMFFQT
jgi:hypothetical protein